MTHLSALWLFAAFGLLICFSTASESDTLSPPDNTPTQAATTTNNNNNEQQQQQQIDPLAGLFASLGNNPMDLLSKLGGLGQVMPLINQFGGVENVLKLFGNEKDFAAIAQQLLQGGNLKDLPSLLDKNGQFLKTLLAKEGEDGGAAGGLGALFGGLLDNDANLAEVAKKLANPEEVNRIMSDPALGKMAQGLMKEAGLPDLFGAGDANFNPADFLQNLDLDSILKGQASNPLLGSAMKALMEDGGIDKLMTPDGPLAGLFDEKNIAGLAGMLGGGNFDSFLSTLLEGDGLQNMMKGFMGGDMGNLFGDLDLDSAFKAFGDLAGGPAKPAKKQLPRKTKSAPVAEQAAGLPNMDEFKAMVEKLGGLDKVADMMKGMGMEDMLEQAGGITALAALIDSPKDKHDEL